MEDRFQEYRNIIGGIVERTYRTTRSRWEGGNHTTRISFTPDGNISAVGVSIFVWNHRKRRGGTDSTITIDVRTDWPEKVHAKELALVDGKLCLDADECQAPAGTERAWKVTLVEQSRGFGLKVTTQYVVKAMTGDLGVGSSLKTALRNALSTYAKVLS